jgi:hypothetical protein
MRAFVPSQVTEFLHNRFSGVTAGTKLQICDYGGALTHLLLMIDNLPEHLVRLEGKASAEFGEAVEAVRIAVARGSGTLDPLTGLQHHPLDFIRRHVAKMPDQGPKETTGRFDFIEHEQLRKVLAMDFDAANQALDNASWKAATVLAGSVTEAILLDGLLPREEAACEAFRKLALSKKLQERDPKTPESWGLRSLTEVALELRLITPPTAAQCDIARNFRNLVHPGSGLRTSTECDRGTALAAVAAVEAVIRDRRR